ncbi:MAG: hypothetical protein EOM26_09195 [Alphaproteobacteria bacterium]|nr:hypothetical protein [Alphaproteobacteria bacterium]
MNRFVKAFCLIAGLSGCGQDNSFDIGELTANPSQDTPPVGEVWLREILTSMKGETGRYLVAAAEQHGVSIAYADDLNHRIGEFSPGRNTVTLELPLGIESATPDQFARMVLTGRRVMYEELDHAVRHHERQGPESLSAQDEVDGLLTAHEAVARISAYVGMSEDAETGSAPDLKTQLGMPESGYAVYYSTTDAGMADVIVSGLEDGAHFHENPELIDKTFAAFYGTSISEWYTLYYASATIPDNFLDRYRTNVTLDRILDDYRQGKPLEAGDFFRHANRIAPPGNILSARLTTDFQNGRFTAEAEKLTLNDLLRFKDKLSRPDGGRADHLARTGSAGDFFRDAPSAELTRAFNILVNDAEVIHRFMASCTGKDYLPAKVQSVAENNHSVLTGYLPVLREAVGSVVRVLGTHELDAASRLRLKQLYEQLEGPLVTPSENRVTIYNNYVNGRRYDNLIACP